MLTHMRLNLSAVSTTCLSGCSSIDLCIDPSYLLPIDLFCASIALSLKSQTQPTLSQPTRRTTTPPCPTRPCVMNRDQLLPLQRVSADRSIDRSMSHHLPLSVIHTTSPPQIPPPSPASRIVTNSYQHAFKTL